ncbi:RICIN domain-containing protein [Edaphocola flava]|uniref:RICIN domain-containing protein n=1 Tax=Edaphocola flava TaxID=2499629 RepID=UPI00100AF5C0|nr:RICIN domain-containing protein [Edaphocola flava]
MMKKMISAMALGICSLTTFAQEVNINCSEGANWQKEKRSVVIFRALEGNCSATLLNGGNGKIYLLTARHCMPNELIGQAVSRNLTFGVENTTCSSTNTNGSTTIPVTLKVVARSPQAGAPQGNLDIALAEVVSDISAIPNVYLSGWDRREIAPTSGTNIGFPGITTKKIGTYNQPPFIYQNDLNMHILFNSTPNGYQGLKGGSSGSSVFDQHHRSVGVVISSYNTDQNPPLPGNYNPIGVISKISSLWSVAANGNTMKNAVDAYNTDIEFVNGMELSELKRILSGAKYLVNKHSGFTIGNGGCYCAVLQSTAPLNTEYTFGCIGCTPYPNDQTRSANRFYIQTDEQGYYKFTHQMAEENLSIENGSLNDGASLKTNAPSNGVNDAFQRFRILPTGDGDDSYYIQNVRSGKYLDVEGASYANGARIIQWTFNGNNNQKWYIRNSDGTNNPISAKTNLLSANEAQPSISVYPVPVTDMLHIALGNNKPEPKSVSVINTLGAAVLQTPQPMINGDRTLNIEVQHLPAGVYYVEVIFENGSRSSAKFIKK